MHRANMANLGEVTSRSPAILAWPPAILRLYSDHIASKGCLTNKIILSAVVCGMYFAGFKCALTTNTAPLSTPSAGNNLRGASRSLEIGKETTHVIVRWTRVEDTTTRRDAEIAPHQVDVVVNATRIKPRSMFQ